jgi:membrane-associated protease RseP (regulator of RpoE activity)
VTDISTPQRDDGPADPVSDPGEISPWSQWTRIALVFAALVWLTRVAGWWGLVIVAGLVFMIFLHELGHFLMAKRAGMKVTEFFIGFGPRIWSFRRGETEYGLKLIPAGAYVRIIGMSMAEQVDPGDEPRTYREQPFWQRFSVAVAGSTMHFIQAIVLIFVILVVLGQPGGTWQLPQSGVVPTQIGDVYANCPAAAAGIRPDDKVRSINGETLHDPSDLSRIVGPLAGKDATFVVDRDGTTKTLTAHIVSKPGDAGGGGLLGVTYGPVPPKTEKVGALAAVPQTFHEFGYALWQTVPAMGKAFSPSSLHSYGQQVVNAQEDKNASTTSVPTGPTTSLAPRSTTPGTATTGKVTTSRCMASMGGAPAFTSKTSIDSNAASSRFMSILGIFEIGKGFAETSGIAALLGLFAYINIFIGIFNLIPMLPFDGGHVVIAIYEKVQEWRKHLKGRYYADLNKLLPVVYVMVFLLGLLFVTSLYLDIANPVKVN